MQKEDLKKLLIELSFLDNAALSAYVNLYESNIDRSKEKFKTQCHHIIPVCHYKAKHRCNTYNEAKRYADADINNPRIHMLYADHILAHYYLVQCCPDHLKYSLYASLFRMLAFNSEIENFSYCINKYMTMDELTEITNYLLQQIDMNVYQKHYEEYLHMNSKKNSNWHKGKTSWIAGKHHTEEAKLKNRLAHLGKPSPVKGIPRSEETRKKLSEAMKGRDLGHAAGKIYIRKDGIVKRISPDDLKLFEADGWEKGRYPTPPEIIRNRKKHEYTEEERQAISARNKGRKRTDEQRRANSEAHRGRTSWNKGKKGEGNSCYGKFAITNGAIMKFWKDDFGPIPEGFYKGTTKSGKAAIPKGTRHWYTNGITDILATTCPEGFRSGRSFAKGLKNKDEI